MAAGVQAEGCLHHPYNRMKETKVEETDVKASRKWWIVAYVC